MTYANYHRQGTVAGASRKACALPLVLVAFLALAGSSLAQQGPTGRLQGCITDETGGALPGVVVQLRSSGGGLAESVDGNDVAGIRLPEIAAPLATYTGWGLRAFPPGGDEGCDVAGQEIDFQPTKVARQSVGDPRLAIEERYPTHAVYVSTVTNVAQKLRQQRLLFDEDLQAYVNGAVKSMIGK